MLAAHFRSLDALCAAGVEELTEIDDVGGEVRRIGHHAAVDELLHHGGAAAVNVHGVPAGRVSQIP